MCDERAVAFLAVTQSRLGVLLGGNIPLRAEGADEVSIPVPYQLGARSEPSHLTVVGANDAEIILEVVAGRIGNRFACFGFDP